MPYLAVPRRGWENEHLATFLLAKIAFVAHPLTVADDVGSDFFCTLFESSNENGMEVLFPRNSFAIQVKSRRENFAATNKIDYLLRLELPFFLGVVDRHTLRLDVYAAEHLPMMFSHLGRPPRTYAMSPGAQRSRRYAAISRQSGRSMYSQPSTRCGTYCSRRPGRTPPQGRRPQRVVFEDSREHCHTHQPGVHLHAGSSWLGPHHGRTKLSGNIPSQLLPEARGSVLQP
jgi:hypothetical protein